MIKYSEDHEWIKVEGDVGTVGITDYAQKALGDIVFVELPPAGDSFAKGDEVAVVESVKAASEIYAPVSGEIVDINDNVEGSPEIVNTSPMDDAWFFKIKLSDEAELDGMMSEDDYNDFVEGLE
jgi:glycine cleavage system H protein